MERGKGMCLICAAAVGTRLPHPSPVPASQITPCALKWTTDGCPGCPVTSSSCEQRADRGDTALLSASFYGHNFCRLFLEVKKSCIFILLRVMESTQHFSEHHFIFCKVPIKFIVCTAFYHIRFWGKVIMILNPKPFLKQIILKFYAVNLVLSSDATFLLILFLLLYAAVQK